MKTNKIQLQPDSCNYLIGSKNQQVMMRQVQARQKRIQAALKSEKSGAVKLEPIIVHDKIDIANRRRKFLSSIQPMEKINFGRTMPQSVDLTAVKSPMQRFEKIHENLNKKQTLPIMKRKLRLSMDKPLAESSLFGPVLPNPRGTVGRKKTLSLQNKTRIYENSIKQQWSENLHASVGSKQFIKNRNNQIFITNENTEGNSPYDSLNQNFQTPQGFFYKDQDIVNQEVPTAQSFHATPKVKFNVVQELRGESPLQNSSRNMSTQQDSSRLDSLRFGSQTSSSRYHVQARHKLRQIVEPTNNRNEYFSAWQSNTLKQINIARQSRQNEINQKLAQEKLHQKTHYLKVLQQDDKYIKQTQLQKKSKNRRLEAPVKKLNEDCSKIDQIVNNITKWSRFKSEKTQIINQYITVKRRVEFLKRVLAQFVATKISRRAHWNYMVAKNAESNFLIKVFLCLKLHKLWRRKHVRRGRPFADIFQQKVRMCSAVVMAGTYHPIRQRALRILRWFIAFSIRFTKLSCVLFNNMLFMQKQFRLRFSTRDAKLEIMTNAWHKLQGQLLELNNEVRSLKMSQLIQEIARVPAMIQRAALIHYLKHCSLAHECAVLQWRLKFSPEKMSDNNMRLDLLEDLLLRTYGSLRNNLEPSTWPDPNTEVDMEFLEKFQEILKKSKSHNIQSFDQIGLPDPYPNEALDTNFVVPSDEKALVYRDGRYQEDSPPTLIYFPGKLVLFKIMRASIAIKQPADLWFQNLDGKLDRKQSTVKHKRMMFALNSSIRQHIGNNE